MKKASKIAALVIGALALSTTAVVAAKHFHHHGAEHRANWIVERVSDELDLQAAQREKLEALSEQLLQIQGSLREERAHMQDEALALLSEPTLDRGRIISLVNERADAVRAHAPQIVDAAGDFYDSLSEEQRTELREHVSEHWSHQHDHDSHD